MYNKAFDKNHNWANTFVWGQNYSTEGRSNSFLYESNYDFFKNALFGRMEQVQKNSHELALSAPHPEGNFRRDGHRHPDGARSEHAHRRPDRSNLPRGGQDSEGKHEVRVRRDISSIPHRSEEVVSPDLTALERDLQAVDGGVEGVGAAER